MKKKKCMIGILTAGVLLVAGCGEKPITLTEEEQALVVDYTAHVVAKYNTRQPDGLSYVSQSRYDKKTGVEEEATENLMEETETEVSEENPPQADGTQQTDQEQHRENPGVSLTEAFGLGEIQAEYAGVELMDSYVEPDVYALNASAGNTFLVLHIRLYNSTNEDVYCDVLTSNPTISAVVNEEVREKARTTILTNDLGTLQSTISAGEDMDTVLFFEVPTDHVSVVDSLKLQVERNGEQKTVEF